MNVFLYIYYLERLFCDRCCNKMLRFFASTNSQDKDKIAERAWKELFLSAKRWCLFLSNWRQSIVTHLLRKYPLFLNLEKSIKAPLHLVWSNGSTIMAHTSVICVWCLTRWFEWLLDHQSTVDSIGNFEAEKIFPESLNYE
jgi:hypothetical protein